MIIVILFIALVTKTSYLFKNPKVYSMMNKDDENNLKHFLTSI